MNKEIISFCKQHRIRWSYESDDEVEFVAPKGFMFSTEARTRLVAIDVEDTRSILHLIRLLPTR